jgi:archaellum component FlaF (FlaF/FlaG flagellin family)
MSRNAIRFIVLYILAVAFFLCCMVTCTSCSSLKKNSIIHISSTDSSATIVKSNQLHRLLDSNYFTQKENEYLKYSIELPKAYSIVYPVWHEGDSLSIVYPVWHEADSVGFSFTVNNEKFSVPRGSKITFEKGSAVETTQGNKKTVDSSLINEQSKTVLKNQSNETIKKTDNKKFLPGWQYIIVVIVLIGLAILTIKYFKKRFLNGI